MGSSTQMSAKDRIEALLDNNSFVEIGALVTKRSTDFNLDKVDAPSDGVITGYGLIDGSLVYVYSQDAKVLHGTIGEMHAKKIVRLYDMALKTGAPVIGLIDCAGIRLQEATDALAGFGEVYFKQTMASGVVPQITAVFGTCGGGSAVSAALSDFTFMPKKNAKLFVNAPNTLEGNYTAKCDTATAEYQATCGVVDVVKEDEAEVLESIRTLVSILPSNNVAEAVVDCEDNLNRAVSFDELCADPAKALEDLSDENFFFEVKAGYAKEMVTGFIKIDGMTIGAVANRIAVLDENGKASEKYEAALTTNGCAKAEQFVKFCDAFNIPVVTFTNVNGYKATVLEEKTIAVAAAKLTAAFANATVAKVNVISGVAYGSTYIVMNSKHIGADMVFAVEGAKIGMMDAALAAQILAPEAKEAERVAVKEAYDSLQGSAKAAAKRGYVDAIVSADSLRQHLSYAFGMLYSKRDTMPVKKHGTI